MRLKSFVPAALAMMTCLGLAVAPAYAKTGSVNSPDGKLSITISDDSGQLMMSVAQGDKALLLPSPIGLTLQGQTAQPRIKGIKTYKTTSETIKSPFYRQSEFDVTYNTMVATLSNGLSVEMRAYDQGVAYRYVSSRKGTTIIANEQAEFTFPTDCMAWLPYTNREQTPLATSFENLYDVTPLSKAQDKLVFLPATFDCSDGTKLTITESDLEAYPGMFVKVNGSKHSVDATFAPYPSEMAFHESRKQAYVAAAHDYIAQADGPRSFPWRIMAVTNDDREMPVNNLVYALASPCRIDDPSWIKGGKIAWDWWNDWSLRNVPFTAGINMDTYKYYVDFASTHGIEYVVLDEGWYPPHGYDILTTIPDINLPELVAYAQKRNVGIVLWTVFNLLDTQLEEACQKYSEMGVKGFKVDFLDRDDQTAVEMAYRIAEGAAKYHMILDLHGFYKPTGINRTYPNILNFEGVFGLENAKWTTPDTDMPQYDVTIPFVRMMAGPMDYTAGAMRNATRHEWKPSYSHPMSMGTRCHQLATYVVFDSPFTMLCDTPSNYLREEECASFIVGVPTDIDETVILSGKIGEQIVTARRHGREWWIGGMTNWTERDVELDLSFLPAGNYHMTIFKDGPNANKSAEDYLVDVRTVNNSTRLPLHMASGGGFALRLTPQ